MKKKGLSEASERKRLKMWAGEGGNKNKSKREHRHLQRRHKLNGADERQRLSRREVELDCVQEVDVVHLDVHKHVEHLDPRRGVDRDCREHTE